MRHLPFYKDVRSFDGAEIFYPIDIRFSFGIRIIERRQHDAAQIVFAVVIDITAHRLQRHRRAVRIAADVHHDVRVVRHERTDGERHPQQREARRRPSMQADAVRQHLALHVGVARNLDAHRAIDIARER